MFALFATERNWLALSQPHLSLGTTVVGTVGWPAFLSLAPAAECCLVAVPPTPPVGLYDALRAFRRSLPYTPLVIVAERALPADVAALGEVVREPLRY